jgi:Fe-S-cluster containining protein
MFDVPELAKPGHEWCPNCERSSGCRIYETRPQTCRDFFCAWRTQAWLGDEWKPLRSRMVITWEDGGNRMVIHVDGGRIDAWRKEPFYGQIKKWAAAAAQANRQVLLWQGRDLLAILPNREKRLGPLRAGQHIATFRIPGPNGPEFDVRILDADDPLLGSARPPQT